MTEDTPNYYTRSGQTCSEVMRPFIDRLSGEEAFYIGNALKYLWRFGEKPGADPVEDLKKARHYIQMAIDLREVRRQKDDIASQLNKTHFTHKEANPKTFIERREDLLCSKVEEWIDRKPSEYPEDDRNVLAKIETTNDLSVNRWYEVVYYSRELGGWRSICSGSKTFEDGEIVKGWAYVDRLVDF